MAPRSAPPPLNPNPFANPDFNAGLEAAGYLQKLDTSEERITARFQHGLEKANFAAHSEEFCGQQGVRKVHRSVVQFFHEEPTPMDPFVHVIVGTLPPPEAATVTPIGSRAESHWVPIQSKYEAEGTMHFTVSIKGFWPITVVFDSNQNDLAREDRYARINPDDDSESDAEAYLDGAARGAYGRGGAVSRARRSSYSNRASGYGGVMRSSSRSSRRRGAYDDDDDEQDEDEFSSEEEDLDAAPPRRRGGGGGSRRGSIARSSRRGSISRGIEDMSLARSSSRASMRRRGSMY
ncbi:hypothetical protein JCM3766R1_005336 [Sporobolomyces carnicolor]